MYPKFDCVAFSFKKSVGNLDDTGEKALYVCKNLKKCVTLSMKNKGVFVLFCFF